MKILKYIFYPVLGWYSLLRDLANPVLKLIPKKEKEDPIKWVIETDEDIKELFRNLE